MKKEMKIKKVIYISIFFIIAVLFWNINSYGADFKKDDEVQCGKKSYWYVHDSSQPGTLAYTKYIDEKGKYHFYQEGTVLTFIQKMSGNDNICKVKDSKGREKFIKIANLVEKGKVEKPKGDEEGTEEMETEDNSDSTSIYTKPEKSLTGGSAQSLDDMISDADSFVKQGKTQYDETALQDFSSTMYNILLSIGVAVALIVGIIIGIKYMMGSIEEKANYKQMLIPYLVGCVVVFGAFGIWKLVVTILESV